MRHIKLTNEITINGIAYKNIYLSNHYKEAHPDITEKEILFLMRGLSSRYFEPCETKLGFSYFASEPEYIKFKAYRIVWLIPESLKYLGVINAFRVRKYDKKN